MQEEEEAKKKEEEEKRREAGGIGDRMVQVYGTGGKRIDMTYS